MKYLTISVFVDVINRETIYKVNRVGFYVINLDDKTGPGTHWVAMYYNPKFTFYFDSFGMPPPQELINKTDDRLVYNSSQYQNLKSVLCGYFCMLFIIEMYRTGDYHHFIRLLSETDSIENEKFVTDYFSQF